MITIQELEQELKASERKLKDLQEWINSRTQHPDFIKIVGDRNALTVHIKTLEFKISNLKNGEAILGEAMDTLELEKQHHAVTTNRHN